jgi:hypothetical protein
MFITSHRSVFMEVLTIFLLSLLPLFWFSGNYVLLGHDSGFRLNYHSQLPNVFYSWDPKVNFGVDWSLFKGFLITQFPEISLGFLTHSFAWGEKLALVFWFAVMGIGMYFFLRRVFPEHKYSFFRIFTSIFYMYNFFILNAWGIGERAKFSLYAAIPVGLLLMYNVFVLNKSVIKNGILFGLLYFCFNGGGVLPLYGATIVVIGLAFVYFTAYRIKKSGWKELLFTIKVLFAFILPFLLLNAYYIIPNVQLLRTSYGSTISNQGGIDGLIAWERVISKNASLINLLRLQGLPTWYDNPSHAYAHLFLTNKILIFASWIPIASIITGLIFFGFRGSSKGQKIILKFLCILLPVGLIAAMGTHPPTGILYEFAMKKIPGFVMFRSSFYKFAPALWFPMIVLSGYYIHQMLQAFLNNKPARNIIAICLTVGLLVYHFPYFTTDTFVLNGGFSTRVKLPEYLTTIGPDIQNIVPEDGAILVMPALDTNYLHLPIDTYTWHYFSLDIFPRNAIQRRIVANDSADPVVRRLYEALYAGDTIQVKKLAGILRIEYILWRGDALLTSATQQENSPETAKITLDSNAAFTRIFESGPWVLYKLNNTFVENHVAVSTNIDAYLGQEEAASYLINMYAGQNRSNFVAVQNKTDLQTNTYQQIFLEAECVMCHDNEFQKLVDSIGLPDQRLTPKSPLFPFEKWRQQRLLVKTADQSKERIDVDIALAQNYLSYANILKSQEYYATYDSYMKNAIEIWGGLDGRDRNTYGIRLLAYLEAQRKFVDPVRQENLDVVSSTIKKDIWMSEPGIYRYMIDLNQDGMYQIVLRAENSENVSISVDGISFQTDTQKQFQQGLHRIEIHITDSQVSHAPYVFLETGNNVDTNNPVEVSFTKVSPTKYIAHISHTSKAPFLLILKEQYDPRWTVSFGNSGHFSVDTFANGWIIDTQGSYDVEIYYQPQNYFYTGLVVSVISGLTATGLLIFYGKRK